MTCLCDGKLSPFQKQVSLVPKACLGECLARTLPPPLPGHCLDNANRHQPKLFWGACEKPGRLVPYGAQTPV